jgi:excisionase family DNA binding protein
MPDRIDNATSLDALARDPAQARELPRDERLKLIQRAGGLLEALRAADMQATLANGATPKAGIEGELLSAEQIAARFNVKTSWVYEWARLGKLPCLQLGRYRRFRLADVQTALNQRNGNPA